MRVMIGMPFGERAAGGEATLAAFLARSRELEVVPHVVFWQQGAWQREVAEDGIATSVIDPGRFRQVHRNVRAAIRLRRLFRRERPDVIVGWISRAHVTFAPAAVAAGMGDRLVWMQQTIPAGELIERAATLMPARLVVACSAAAEAAQRQMWPARATHVVHPGIEPPRARPQAEIRELRERLGIPSGRTVIGISGRLVRWKGQHRMLEAVAALLAAGCDVHALVVGGTAHGLEASYPGELRELVERLRIGDRVTFTGHVADAAAHTQLMDVLVNASDPEPFGLTLLEAMALEVPVVAVDRGGPREIVEHAESGLLASSGASEDLAAALRALVEDPQRRRTLARHGRERVLAHFTADHMAAGYRAAFERVARAADGRD